MLPSASKFIRALRRTQSLEKLAILLKLSITAPPVDGKANDACIEFFSKLLRIPRSSITIASGQNSRNKVIRVAGISAEMIRERFGV